jgi:hypothetical protein
VYKRECVPSGQATVHIIVGTAGAGLETGGFSNKLGNWSVSQLEDWGYNRIQATPTSMHVEFVRNSDGFVFDEVDLTPWF